MSTPYTFSTVEQAFAAINYSVHSGSNPQATLHALQSEFAWMLGIIRDDCADEYHAALKKAQEEKGEVCSISCHVLVSCCIYTYMYTCRRLHMYMCLLQKSDVKNNVVDCVWVSLL